MFLVIVASHIRPRVMIISVKDCDHRSQPDVWGNNDRQHRIKPLIPADISSRFYSKIWIYFTSLYHSQFTSSMDADATPIHYGSVTTATVFVQVVYMVDSIQVMHTISSDLPRVYQPSFKINQSDYAITPFNLLLVQSQPATNLFENLGDPVKMGIVKIKDHRGYMRLPL